MCLSSPSSKLLIENAGVVSADMICLILYNLSGHSTKQVDTHEDDCQDCWRSPGIAGGEAEVSEESLHHYGRVDQQAVQQRVLGYV